MERTQNFFILVPVLLFHLLGLILKSGVDTHCSHVCFHIPYQKEVHYLPLGASLNCSRTPWEIVQRERQSVLLPHPKGKSPIVSCCFPVPHGVLLNTGGHLVASDTDPLLGMLRRRSLSLLGSAKVRQVTSQDRALQLHAQPFPHGQGPRKLWVRICSDICHFTDPEPLPPLSPRIHPQEAGRWRLSQIPNANTLILSSLSPGSEVYHPSL